ncbi:hypothetical protein EIP91_005447 [Steccherinum ochraceum]|uniref:F-box domain-containing protein n=1 Tax=Steccherinum ochraceum TaxID=92696 RepID=A0A4R0RS59_9APHY|nr:hypothetical protein EIP91_005447 [Steccherinum ochraceum]
MVPTLQTEHLVCSTCSPSVATTSSQILEEHPAMVWAYDTARLELMTHTLDDTVAKCRRAIASYEHAVSALNTQRNACFSRICQVPNDVFENILYHALECEQGSLVMLQLAQVSHFWHDFIHGSDSKRGRLWSVIKVKGHISVRFIQEFLTRSRGSLLDVSANFERNYDAKDVLSVLIGGHMPRIRHLRLLACSEDFTHISSMLFEPQSHLLSLSLSISDYGVTLQMSDHLGPDTFPALRRLEVMRFPIPWIPPFSVTTLTHFELDMSRWSWTPAEIQAYGAPLLDAIGEMSALTVLKLTSVPSPPPRARCWDTTLPRLSDIHLAGGMDTVGLWLSLIFASPTAHVRLVCAPVTARDDYAITCLGQGISALAGTGWASTFTSPQLRVSAAFDEYSRGTSGESHPPPTLETHFALWANPKSRDPELFQAPRPQLHLTLKEDNRWPGWLGHHRLAGMWRCLPLASVRTLMLTSDYGTQSLRRDQGISLLTSGAFMSCIREMHAVDRLHLDGRDTEWGLGLLTPPRTHRRRDPINFPFLRLLTVKDARLGDTVEAQLRTALQIRREKYRTALRELRFVNHSKWLDLKDRDICKTFRHVVEKCTTSSWHRKRPRRTYFSDSSSE